MATTFDPGKRRRFHSRAHRCSQGCSWRPGAAFAFHLPTIETGAAAPIVMITGRSAADDSAGGMGSRAISTPFDLFSLCFFPFDMLLSSFYSFTLWSRDGKCMELYVCVMNCLFLFSIRMRPVGGLCGSLSLTSHHRSMGLRENDEF